MTSSTVTARAARRALYDIVRRDVSFETKAREALDLGTRFLDVETGYLVRTNPEADSGKVLVSTDPGDERLPAGGAAEDDLADLRCIDGGSVALQDGPAGGRIEAPDCGTGGPACYHGTPIVVDDESYGTVCFVDDASREPFTDCEAMFAELVARLLERELEADRHEAELTRQATLTTVLNRVLRHNLRNKLSIIRGYTQLMADRVDADDLGTTALDNIDELSELCGKARELDEVVAADFAHDPTDVATVVSAVADRIAGEYPDASIAVDADGPITAAVAPSFERAVAELVENAAKHGGDGPTVTVAVAETPIEVEVRISDDGPGLADHEIAVLETGSETPLTHGSGLGLWLTHWIVTGHGGSVDASVSAGGTTMRITVPKSSTPTEPGGWRTDDGFDTDRR